MSTTPPSVAHIISDKVFNGMSCRIPHIQFSCLEYWYSSFKKILNSICSQIKTILDHQIAETKLCKTLNEAQYSVPWLRVPNSIHRCISIRREIQQPKNFIFKNEAANGHCIISSSIIKFEWICVFICLFVRVAWALSDETCPYIHSKWLR